jgi:hypothetical protein
MIKHRSGTRWPDEWEVGWRCVRFAPLRRRWTRVSWFSLKTKIDGFFRFGLKTGCYGSCDLSSKPLARFSRFEPQNRQLRLVNLTHKITTTVSWFGSQNQVGWGLSVCASKLMSGWRLCEDTHRHPAASFITKHVRLGFPSFASKLVEERRRVVHVAS